MEIDKAHGRFCLAKGKLDGDVIQKLASLPGCKKWVGRDLLFAPTGANISHINKHWPRAEWSEAATPILDDYIETMHQAELTRKEKSAAPRDLGDFLFKTKPFDHQRKAFYMSRDKESFALLMEQGTGKTKVNTIRTAMIVLYKLRTIKSPHVRLGSSFMDSRSGSTIAS